MSPACPIDTTPTFRSGDSGFSGPPLTLSADHDSVVMLPETPRDWVTFLRDYANGHWEDLGALSSPSSTSSSSSRSTSRSKSRVEARVWSGGDSEAKAGALGSLDHHLYPDVDITPATAATIRDFVKSHDYLPPPRSPLEQRRLECIEQYDLHGPAQITNIQRAIDVVAAMFPDTLVTFTLFDGRTQSFIALGGSESLMQRYGLVVRAAIPSHNSLCGHAVLLKDRVMCIPDLRCDHRTRSNPYTQAGVISYIGSAVSLQLDPLNQANDQSIRVGIGALNILYVDTKCDKLSDTQKRFVDNVTRMLETQLRGTWEGVSRTKEGRMRYAISDMIQRSFLEEQARRQAGSQMAGGDPTSGRVLEEHAGYREMARHALDYLTGSLGRQSTSAIVDIGYDTREDDTFVSLDCVAKDEKRDWSIPDRVPRASIIHPDSIHYFQIHAQQSGLEQHLPTGTCSHLVVPFFTSDRPLFAIIVACHDQDISETNTTFVRTLGAVLLARRVQDMALSAEYAKTAFLSSISHELRTPLHSLVNGVDLARLAAEVQDWQEVSSILDIAKASGVTLRTILNDVLDYGKPTTATSPPYPSAADNRTDGNVLSLVRDAASMALDQHQDLDDGFSLCLRYEKIDWEVRIDLAKYQRLVLNGLTNALKFCKGGAVTIELSRTTESTFVTRITDDGVGFDQSSLPYLMQAFAKGQDYAPGAGLGLHIADRLALELQGSLTLQSQPRKGTTFEVRVSADFATPVPTISCDDREIIQDLLKRIAVNRLPPTLTTDGDASDSLSDAELILTPPRSRSDSLEPAPIRVLLVDDNLVCRRILGKAVKRLGVPTITAEADNGQSAVAMYVSFVPDLVLTDVSMPVMDGVTAAQHMRELGRKYNSPDCRIYAITGLGSTDPRLKIAALNGTAALDGWLVKGQDDLSAISKIISEMWEERTCR